MQAQINSAVIEDAEKGGKTSRPLPEILAVFSPFLPLVVGYKVAGITDPMILIAAIWCTYIVMLVIIGFVLRRRGESWSSIGLDFGSFKNIPRTVLKSIGVFVFAMAGFVLGSIVMANIVGVPEPADMSRYNYLSGNLPLLLITLVGVYVVSSFGEEVIYRGFLITRLEELFGGRRRTEDANDLVETLRQDEDGDTTAESDDPEEPLKKARRTWRGPVIGALVLSSLIFGLIHFEWGAMGIVQTTFMGAALSISFVWNRYGLWPLILAHCYLDTILLVQLYMA